MRTRALCTVLLVCALVVSLVPVTGAWAQGTAGIGAAIPVTDEEGSPVGSITVTEVADPFTAFDPTFPAEAGSRYVVLTVAFDADAGQRFDISPYSIVLQDDAGFLWSQSGLYLTDESLIPELTSQTLAPGSRVTGLVGFQLPDGAKPARVFYQPESGRLVTLATLLDLDEPGIGDAVGITDSNGGVGSVTVTAIEDPFLDFDPGQTPPEGTRYVLVTLVYENTGDGRFFIEPYDLTLHDSDGRLWRSTYVSRPAESSLIPDLTSAQLAPGDRLSGALIFAVPENAEPAGLYAMPVSGQLLTLATLGADTVATVDQQEVAETPVEESPVAEAPVVAEETPVTDSVPAATDETTDSAVTTAADSCADLGQWLAATRARIQQATAMSAEDATLTDLEGLRQHVAAYRTLSAEQLADTPPPGAEGVNKALAATFNAYAAAVEQVLGATEPGKDTLVELTEGMDTFSRAGMRLQQIEQELDRLAAECGL